MKKIRYLVVYGTHGHGLEVAESASAQGWQIRGFIDEIPTASMVGPYRLMSRMPDPDTDDMLFVGVADNLARRRICSDLVQAGFQMATVIHPAAWVSPSAILGLGVYIGAGAVVSARAQIGFGTTVHSGAVIEHEARIASFVRVGAHATIGNQARIDELASIGPAATILPRAHLEEGCIVRGGSAVEGDVGHGQDVLGVPARPRNGERAMLHTGESSGPLTN